MEIKNLLNTLKELKEASPKRKFPQTYELIINLKDLDLKKPDQQVDFFANLHHSKGKPVKVAALVGPELIKQAKEECDSAFAVDEFDTVAKDKKVLKKIASEHDYFIAQATVMPKIATSFGRVLGPKGKMPNPKAGCVVPPNANLKPLYDKLQKTVRVTAKTAMMIQAPVATEAMKEEDIADNIKTLYDQIIHHLPAEKNNIRRVLLKLTMGKPIKLDDKGNILKGEEEPVEEAPKKNTKSE
jgi:large subunit ribosomal protein L1